MTPLDAARASIAGRLIERVVAEGDGIANHGAAALRKALDLLDIDGDEDRAMSVLVVLVAHFDTELSEALDGAVRGGRVYEAGGGQVYRPARYGKPKGW